jgi:hypothetical protein
MNGRAVRPCAKPGTMPEDIVAPYAKIAIGFGGRGRIEISV